MQPSSGNTSLRRRLGGWFRKIRYVGREGISLARMLDAAKRFQEAGDDAGMASALKSVDVIAASISRTDRSFAAGWKAAVEYRLALFDLPAAARLAMRARELQLPDAIPVTENLAAITAETTGWRDAIAAAAISLRQGPRNSRAPHGSLLVLVPSRAFGLDLPNEPTLQGSLRFIFGEILTACRDHAIPVEIRGRLATHGTPQMEADRRYVSHHSRGDDDRGLHIKATDRPSCFSFDTRGYSGWSKFVSTPLEELGRDDPSEAVIDEFFAREQERIISGNISKYRQSAAADLTDLPAEYVFVGLQMPGDAVQQLARISMLDMLAEVAAACNPRGIPVIVKRHPKCTSGRVRRALAKGVAAGQYQLSTASVHSLIAGSCAVCVVNSSVGAEALLHEKPVYLFGAAEYQHVCFRMGAAGDFAKLFRPGQLPVPSAVLRRFLYRLRHEYAVDVTDQAAASAFIRRRVLEHVFAGQSFGAP